MAMVSCGQEPAVRIPVQEGATPQASRDVVPSIIRGGKGSKTNAVNLDGTVSREALTAKILPYAELSPLDQTVITTLTNTVEAPCEPCTGRTLASCLIEMPDRCENLTELLNRTVQMINSGAPPNDIRAAITYTDAWVPLPAPDGRSIDGDVDGVRVEVWVDPASSSVRAVTDTLDKLDLRSVGVLFRIVPMTKDPAHRAWAAAAIAAEAQGKLEVFLRAARTWRDEQRDVQGALTLTVKAADLDVVAVAIAGEGFDLDRFHRDRQSDVTSKRIDRDLVLAEQVGVRVVPSWFVDGYRLRGAQSAGAIQGVINLERIDHLNRTTPRSSGE
jgi:protein-disulfide isomerase